MQNVLVTIREHYQRYGGLTQQNIIPTFFDIWEEQNPIIVRTELVETLLLTSAVLQRRVSVISVIRVVKEGIIDI